MVWERSCRLGLRSTSLHSLQWQRYAWTLTKLEDVTLAILLRTVERLKLKRPSSMQSRAAACELCATKLPSTLHALNACQRIAAHTFFGRVGVTGVLPCSHHLCSRSPQACHAVDASPASLVPRGPRVCHRVTMTVFSSYGRIATGGGQVRGTAGQRIPLAANDLQADLEVESIRLAAVCDKSSRASASAHPACGGFVGARIVQCT